jgi:hypothetical protein
LLDGAPPSVATATAAAAGIIGRGATAGSADRRWIAHACAPRHFDRSR